MKHEQYTIIPSERIGLQTGDTCYILNQEDLLRIVDELTEEATENLFHLKIYHSLERLLPRAIVIEDFRGED